MIQYESEEFILIRAQAQLAVQVSVRQTLEAGWYVTDADHKLYQDTPLPTVLKGCDPRELVVRVGVEKAEVTQLVQKLRGMHELRS